MEQAGLERWRQAKQASCKHIVSTSTPPYWTRSLEWEDDDEVMDSLPNDDTMASQNAILTTSSATDYFCQLLSEMQELRLCCVLWSRPLRRSKEEAIWRNTNEVPSKAKSSGHTKPRHLPLSPTTRINPLPQLFRQWLKDP